MTKMRNCLLGGVTALLCTPALAQQDTAVTIVLSEELENVDPCMAAQANIGRVLLQNISETLTELDERDSTLKPRLATDWSQQGGGTWRFQLRSGVTFSDGSSFDAADVKHSITRTTSDQLTCETGAKFFGGFDISADVVDENTIDITTDPAQPILPLLMSTLTIVPEDTPIEFTRDPVGTGPYEMTALNPGRNIVLTRRDDYWGEMPAVSKATYVFRSEPSVRAAMVETGEADIAPSISQVQATNPDTDFSYPNSETSYLRIDHAIPPLNDVRIRKALNLAIDRKAFLGTLLPKEATLATHLVPPSTMGVNPDLEPYPFAPERARQLLEEARADGVPVDETITLIGRTGFFPNVTEVLEAMASMMEDVGFSIDLQMYEVAEWQNLYSHPFAEDRGPQLINSLHDNNRGDPVFTMYFKYACEGATSGLCDPKVDDLIAKATAATGDKRARLWRELFAYLHEDVVADVLMFNMVGFSRVSERLDFTPTIATKSELQLSEIGFH